LSPSPPFKVPDWGSDVDWVLDPSQKVATHWTTIRTFLGWKLVGTGAGAVVMWAAVTVLLPGFQNIGGGDDGNHDVDGPFWHFGFFVIMRALMMQFV
jgi:hypothetical protein